MSKAKEVTKQVKECRVEGCTKKAITKGLCSQHYKRHYKTGIVKGVYVLILNKQKTYVGVSSIAGIEVRIQRHKTALINNIKKNAISEVLDYFNVLCDENPQYTRKEVWNNFVEYKTLESAPILITRDENGFNFDPQSARDGFRTLDRNPKIVQKTKKYWKKVEDYYIKKYQELDAKNGTNHCLNKCKKRYEKRNEDKKCL